MMRKLKQIRRFDSVIERFNSSDNTLVDQVDTIADLEIKFSKITTQMTDLNDAIKKVDDEIKEMETNKSIDEPDEGDDPDDESHIIKQCKFDKYGYCNRGATNCSFFHSLEKCEIYLDTGFCNKETCRKRHPKPCYHFGKGYCKHDEKYGFLHKNEPL